MYFKCNDSSDGKIQYYFDGKLTIDKFFLMMDAVAGSFGVDSEYIFMPEAEVIKIKLGTGIIYAKYDLDYGPEVECAGLSVSQTAQFEDVLLHRL